MDHFVQLARSLARVGALIVLVWLVLIDDAHAEKRIALVVGNSGYQNITRLDNPKNDAKLMAETLSGLDFTLIGGNAQLDSGEAVVETIRAARAVSARRPSLPPVDPA